MQLRLSCDDDRVNDVALDGQTVAIGRHPDNAIIIRDDLASRFHCVLEPADGDMYRLRDLGSRNGTKMAGERISEVLLSDGDVFTIGKRTFTIRNDAAVEVVADPPSTGTPRRPRRRPKLSHPVGQAASGGGDAAGGAWEGELEQIIERLGETESDGGLELVDTRGGA
ncbi:MAG: FHA domain-containing protein, partial [Planctomycetota bacterium]